MTLWNRLIILYTLITWLSHWSEKCTNDVSSTVTQTVPHPHPTLCVSENSRRKLWASPLHPATHLAGQVSLPVPDLQLCLISEPSVAPPLLQVPDSSYALQTYPVSFQVQLFSLHPLLNWEELERTISCTYVPHANLVLFSALSRYTTKVNWMDFHCNNPRSDLHHLRPRVWQQLSKPNLSLIPSIKHIKTSLCNIKALSHLPFPIKLFHVQLSFPFP